MASIFKHTRGGGMDETESQFTFCSTKGFSEYTRPNVPLMAQDAETRREERSPETWNRLPYVFRPLLDYLITLPSRFLVSSILTSRVLTGFSRKTLPRRPRTTAPCSAQDARHNASASRSQEPWSEKIRFHLIQGSAWFRIQLKVCWRKVLRVTR